MFPFPFFGEHFQTALSLSFGRSISRPKHVKCHYGPSLICLEELRSFRLRDVSLTDSSLTS